MTSPAKARANRRNGRKSNGPTSAAGKAIAARNAHRHGLSLPVLADPAASREADDLAHTIAVSVTGAAADPAHHEIACRIAEAQLDLRRVRLAKQPLMVDLVADPTAPGRLKGLLRLDRYERRALARRKAAIRTFDAALAPAGRVGRTNPTGKGQ